MEFTTSEMLQAQLLLYSQSFAFLNSMVLKCAVQLGLPDVVHKHGGPMTLAELVHTLSIPSAKLNAMHRLMRILVRLGIFAVRNHAGDDEAYVLTPLSMSLLSNQKTCFYPILLLPLDPNVMSSMQMLATWFTTDSAQATPFEMLHGKGLWEFAESNPEFNQVVNEALATESAMVAEEVVQGSLHVFQGLKSLVDVGGGTGTMARAIAGAFPEIKCTVFDLPHVIATQPEDSTVEYVGGDIFHGIPRADAVLLKYVLHDWSDEDCIKILKRCGEAIPSKDEGGKIVIIEIVVDTKSDDRLSVDVQLQFDLTMMLLTTGKERSRDEWHGIFSAAGFSDYKISPLVGLRSIIELYR